VDQTLTYTPTVEWEDSRVYWTGVLTKGTHEAFVSASRNGVYGCGKDWGDMQAVWMSAKHVASYQVPDLDAGCPNTQGGVLVHKSVSTTSNAAMVIITGHIIHHGKGRADLHLYLDNNMVDRTLT